MLKASTVASFFIEQSSKLPENDLTNLKLQKILFYAQAEALNLTGDKVFSEDVEAWKFGPVVPEVYEWLKGCGAYPITTFDIATDTSDINEETWALLEQVWNAYSKYSAGYLVDRTHEAGSPWERAFESSKNNVIPYDQIATAKLQAAW